MPGLSDHDTPYLEFQTHPAHQKQTHRSVPHYTKADRPKLPQAAQQLSNDITTKFDAHSNPEDMWTEFKGKLHSAAETHIPVTTFRPKNSKPWVDYNTKKKRQTLQEMEEVW